MDMQFSKGVKFERSKGFVLCGGQYLQLIAP